MFVFLYNIVSWLGPSFKFLIQSELQQRSAPKLTLTIFPRSDEPLREILSKFLLCPHCPSWFLLVSALRIEVFVIYFHRCMLALKFSSFSAQILSVNNNLSVGNLAQRKEVLLGLCTPYTRPNLQSKASSRWNGPWQA